MQLADIDSTMTFLPELNLMYLFYNCFITMSRIFSLVWGRSVLWDGVNYRAVGML